jgi:hypothetical protein
MPITSAKQKAESRNWYNFGRIGVPQMTSYSKKNNNFAISQIEILKYSRRLLKKFRKCHNSLASISKVFFVNGGGADGIFIFALNMFLGAKCTKM